MSLVMPYDKLSVIVSNSQLVVPTKCRYPESHQSGLFHSRRADLLAIIPSLLRSPGEKKIAKFQRADCEIRGVESACI